MDTKIALDIAAAEQEAKYDAQVKLLLSEKSILARIMQGCLKEYADCTPEEISNCIEGNPAISEIALHPNG